MILLHVAPYALPSSNWLIPVVCFRLWSIWFNCLEEGNSCSLCFPSWQCCYKSCGAQSTGEVLVSHGTRAQKSGPRLLFFNTSIFHCRISFRNFFHIILANHHQVSEELEERLGLTAAGSHPLRRSPSLRVQAPEPLPVNIPLHLVFPKTLKLPIFTLNEIVSHDNSPVRVVLLDPRSDLNIDTVGPLSTFLRFPIKLEIMVLDGDFRPLRPDGDGVWTAEEFENSIIRARVGKRPLLAGDLTATLRPDDGSRELLMTSFAQLQLTDNSSWIRSRKFRLGVRVIPGSYPGVVRIQEAVSEPFVVRDHRGKSYEKHYPPKLEDEVWRLEKIGKEGNLSMKLASAGVITVQDFLKMSIVNPQPLRRVGD
ncbi:protein SAR DEFICIENT 1-like isoform X3 [Punica granatum]|uniref:Protein SAR DEFICIENT 1-like isoform X3 n=1 Tax=Punica granatum TaxID=22663 RepID=A0A6P8BNC7_PUNGR|nr:protein SAR DEFICIENT 1-like isoform X3 [Punica granatum]